MAEACADVAEPLVQDRKENKIEDCPKVKLDRILGKGAVGTVYLAKDDTGRSIAIKTFALSGDRADRCKEEFDREAYFMQTLKHGWLVPCFFAAEYSDCLAIAMPYYVGGDLRDVWRKRQKPDMLKITKNIVELSVALEYLHSNSVAHKDIKLSNVFLDESGRAILGDFGHALTVKTKNKTLPLRSMGGTNGYKPPEWINARLSDPVDPFKGDVYALGVIWWLLVSNGTFDDTANYLAKLQAAKTLRMARVKRSILERMLEPDPSKRVTANMVVRMLFCAMGSRLP